MNRFLAVFAFCAVFVTFEASLAFTIGYSRLYSATASKPYERAEDVGAMALHRHVSKKCNKAHHCTYTFARRSQPWALYGYKKSPSGQGRFKPSPPNRSERSYRGFTYADKYGIYEIPFIDEPMWFFIDVDGRITLDVADRLRRLILDRKWEGILEDVYCPQKVPYVRFKEGKLLRYIPTALYPGHLFVKCTMSPDIADRLETISGVMRMRVNEDGFLVPLTPEEVENLVEQRETESIEMDKMMGILETGNYYIPGIEDCGSTSMISGNSDSGDEFTPPESLSAYPDHRIRKGGSVAILEGSYAGRRGIARGTEAGQVAVDVIDGEVTHRVLFDLGAVQYRPFVSK